MTRGPDRFDAQARELLREIHHGVLNLEQAELHANKVAAALRAAEASALERAAQEILIAFDDACWDGLAERVRTGKWTMEKSNV